MAARPAARRKCLKMNDLDNLLRRFHANIDSNDCLNFRQQK
jgi:hypothetical protein